MAGSSNQEVHEEHGLVRVFFFFSVCASPRVCMFVSAAMKRNDEPREVCGRGGGSGGTAHETGVGCALQQLGTKEACCCCYYACWCFLQGDKLGPAR